MTEPESDLSTALATVRNDEKQLRDTAIGADLERSERLASALTTDRDSIVPEA